MVNSNSNYPLATVECRPRNNTKSPYKTHNLRSDAINSVSIINSSPVILNSNLSEVRSFSFLDYVARSTSLKYRRVSEQL